MKRLRRFFRVDIFSFKTKTPTRLKNEREREGESGGGGGGEEREKERERENSKTLILKDSSVRAIWTYLTASPRYTTNTNKHDNTTNRYYKYE